MITFLHLVICTFIFVTSIYRALKMSGSTAREIRWCMSALGGASFGLILAPSAWDFVASPPMLLFEAAVAMVQYVTGRLWSKGVPEQFRR